MNAADPRRSSPAALRNREPILAVLRANLPADTARVLEIASGTGEHAVFFAQNLPTQIVWQPSDPDAANRASIAAYRSDAALANLRAPLDLDAAAPIWPIASTDAIFCANMIHISPWHAGLGLLAGAKRSLRPGGVLILYGPFFEDGKIPAASNVAFDADLRARNPAWGIRKLEDVAKAADGFAPPTRIAMPANNLCVVFAREA